ncbi:MAG: type II toxin-antitoxin system VapC family toxin [Vicinamibacteria bacterium]
MAVRYLLDTNVVSFHIRGSSAALQGRLRRIKAASVALSVVTEMEIRFGLARNPGLRIAPLVEQFLDAMTILPLDSDVARAYGRIRSELETEGRPIGPLDTMIAAHAVSVGATLVTNDVREFRRVRGLRVADWTK